MAFGIPNSDGGTSNGKFLGRIQFDARVGFWKIVKRIQHSDGSYGDQVSEPFNGSAQNPVSLLMDMGSLEVGYMKISSPPSFLVVPYGHVIPPQPEEMSQGQKPGDKPRKAFQPGFRIQVCSPKTFGDGDAYYFSNTSKTVMGPMDTLHQQFLAAAEAQEGMIPVVVIKKCVPTTIKTPQGNSTFYAPEFEIASWQQRLPVFGDRTVPAPQGGARTSAPPAPTPVSNHVPPPAPKPTAPPPAPISAPAMGVGPDDEVPFAPEFR